MSTRDQVIDRIKTVLDNLEGVCTNTIRAEAIVDELVKLEDDYQQENSNRKEWDN